MIVLKVKYIFCDFSFNDHYSLEQVIFMWGYVIVPVLFPRESRWFWEAPYLLTLFTRLFAIYSWLPPELEKREGIFQSGNFHKTGKVRDFYSRCWKNPLFFYKYFLASLRSTFLYYCSFKVHSFSKEVTTLINLNTE